MAKRTQHTIGLDIGTSKVTCIAGEPGEGGLLEVVGIGEAEARGLRKGVIVNPDAAVDAIKKAVEDAERMSGLEAEEVTINLAGSHILGFNGQAIVAVSVATARSSLKMCDARSTQRVRFNFQPAARSSIDCRRSSSSTIRMASMIRLA